MGPNSNLTARLPGPLSRVPWAVVVYLAVALPLILSGFDRGRGQFDQQFFHEPAIHGFAAQWPHVDLSNYLSATTPGYHLVLAAVCRYMATPVPLEVIADPSRGAPAQIAALEQGRLLLKLVGAGFTVAWLWVLSAAVRARLVGGERGGGGGGGGKTLTLLLPLVCSMYALFAGIWLLPDNAGWLGVTVMLVLMLRRRWDWHSLIVGGVVMVLLVWMRQSHIWAAGLMWVAAWIGGTGERFSGRVDEESGVEAQSHRGIEWVLQPTLPRIRRGTIALLATLPAVLMLYWFYRLWGGSLINHNAELRSRHGTAPNFATPAFAMSLWAIFSGFFGAWVWPGVVSLWKSRDGVLMLGLAVVIGVLAATIPETTFLYDDPQTHLSRATGLWNAVLRLDQHGLTLAGRTSPLILVLAPMGMVALAGWLARMPGRCPWVYGLSLAGFALAQSANSAAWQRYIEPMLLMVMALMAAEIAGSPDPDRKPRMRVLMWTGPVVLGVLHAAITVYTLLKASPVVKTW